MSFSHCYCYFAIKGDFNPKEITYKLQIKPSKYWSIGDLRANGSRYGFAFWETGYTLMQHPDIEIHCINVVRELIGKECVLNKIKGSYDLTFTVQIVPSIYNGVSPVIIFGKEFLTFCAQTDTDIDIDMYVFPFNDPEADSQTERTTDHKEGDVQNFKEI